MAYQRLHLLTALAVLLFSWAPSITSIRLEKAATVKESVPEKASAQPSSTAAAGTERVHRDTWVIDSHIVNADCQYDRPTPLVNGMLPGPVITVVEGTRIIIEVQNKQSYPVTIHWHGIIQNGSQWHDGVPGVTQCSIEANQTFTYNFSSWGKAGTLWWHTHVAMLRNTIFGGLNVLPAAGTLNLYGRRAAPVHIEGDAHIFLSDWYETSPADMEASVVQTLSLGGAPDALLLNGATYFPDNPTCNLGKVFEVVVKPKKWYRLRVVNSGLYAAVNFLIQNHSIWTYEGEGGYLWPVKFPSYTVLSGQSYAFLLYTNSTPGTYWMVSRPGNSDVYDTPPGLGLLRYSNSPALASGQYPDLPDSLIAPPPANYMDIQLRKSVASTPPEPWIKHVDKLVVLELSYATNGRSRRYSLNNASLALPSIPALYDAYKGLSAGLNVGYTPTRPVGDMTNYNGPGKVGSGVIKVAYGQVVQLVIQQQWQIQQWPHPFHLHGHNFYVVGRGLGKFNASRWTKYRYNLVSPVYRNTMWVRGYETKHNAWTAVRFKADNPGVWLLHCHLEPHADGGMMAMFYVEKEGGILAPPSDYPLCNGTKLES